MVRTTRVGRASIPGIGKDSLQVVIKETGAHETVYTYGEYMRRFINDVKAKGAHPILMSLTPRNAWEDADSTIVKRVNKTFGLWAKQVAKKAKVPFIDLNEITARKFEKFGKEKVKYHFYLDRIHTSEFGAELMWSRQLKASATTKAYHWRLCCFRKRKTARRAHRERATIPSFSPLATAPSRTKTRMKTACGAGEP